VRLIVGGVLLDGRTRDRLLVPAEQSLLELPQVLLIYLAEENGEMIDLFGVMGEEWF